MSIHEPKCEEDGEYVERPYDPENGIYRGHPGLRS